MRPPPPPDPWLDLFAMALILAVTLVVLFVARGGDVRP